MTASSALVWEIKNGEATTLEAAPWSSREQTQESTLERDIRSLSAQIDAPVVTVPAPITPMPVPIPQQLDLGPSPIHPAIAHFGMLFEPSDRICITVIDATTGDASNYFMSASEASTPENIAWLEQQNKTCNTYVAMNPILPNVSNRRKESVGTPRNVFMEVDTNGDTTLEAVQESVGNGEIQEPTVILRSSPGKYQFVWHINFEEFNATQIEAVNAALVHKFGADPACTDVLRVLRIPGFQNLKYDERPMVEVISATTTPGHHYGYDEFKIPIGMPRENILCPAVGDDEFRGIMGHFEIAAEQAHLSISKIKKWGSQGFLWEITCPWLEEHTGQLDTGTVVILHPSGALDFVCRHGHCRQRTWQKDMRPRMEEMAGHFLRFGDPVENLVLNSTPKDDIAPTPLEYVLTEQEYELEIDKEFPVIPLAEQPGPAWEDAILYGPAGRVIEKACRYSEAHPSGMLLDFLVSMGNAFGRSAYFNVGATKHFTNEFLARVGDSSDTRKGTGRDAIDELVRLVDPTWFSNSVKSGFGSSEVITYLIRDGFIQKVFDKKKKTYTEVAVPGVDDKRLYVREGELASLFMMASKKDSRASVTLRDGFDSKKLSNLVKGNTEGVNNSVSCAEPHLSISGDTTRSEILRTMPTGSEENGFGNRFLYCNVYRTKLCPNGGPPLDWAHEVLYFLGVVEFAKKQKHIPLAADARTAWNRMYLQIEGDKLPGVAGKMTRRGAAHTKRLALIYAMIDKSDCITLKHLHAAKRLWDYCFESAQYIFNKFTRDQLQIIEFAQGKATTTLTAIREELFQRNKKVAWIETQVRDLVSRGHLAQTNGEIKSLGSK